MTNVTAPITDSTWAIITYEESWETYINSYVIKQENTYVLIDSHLRKHRAYFQQALSEIGVGWEQIECVYYTHRGADRIGNAELFPSRLNWIHLDDYYELDDFSQTLFGHTFTGSGGEFSALKFRELSFFTEGSVAFFDPKTKICFAGGHLRFTRTPIGSIVGREEECRIAFREQIEQWAGKEPQRAEEYADGLEQLLKWPMEYLAPGNGPILAGEIAPFLRELIDVIRRQVQKS